jgi:hypothetical protein
MITGNISTYIGQDGDAEHYYCSYRISEDEFPKTNSGGSYGRTDLKHPLSYAQASAMSRKDHFHWEEGTMSNRFDTIEEIHEYLKQKFPNEIIVTYYEGQLFKEMLYIKEGKNLGYEAFGEVWSCVPRSVYKRLLPADLKIKCCECGHEYKLEEVTSERSWGEETLVQFLDKRDLEEDPCCKYFDLEWNVIL